MDKGQPLIIMLTCLIISHVALGLMGEFLIHFEITDLGENAFFVFVCFLLYCINIYFCLLIWLTKFFFSPSSHISGHSAL